MSAERLAKIGLWAVLAVLVGLVLFVSAPAKSTPHHDLYLRVFALCTTKEAVYTVVETTNPERQILWRKYIHSGICRGFPGLLPVAVHQMLADTTWAGDGDPVVVLELHDRQGRTLYAWFTKEVWDGFDNAVEI